MAKKTTAAQAEPVKQNMLRLARDKAGMTRKEVEARCQWMNESRLCKLESGVQRITPDDVFALSRVYGDEDLCRTYCHKVCAIGCARDEGEGECKPVAQIVIEMLSALNAANRGKDQIVEILADGKISDEEFADIVEIKKELMRMSEVTDDLQKWIESMLDGQLIPQIFDER